jgi:hypothetical protein
MIPGHDPRKVVFWDRSRTSWWGLELQISYIFIFFLFNIKERPFSKVDAET